METNVAQVIKLPTKKKNKKRKKPKKGLKFLNKTKTKIDPYEILTIMLGVIAGDIIYDYLRIFMQHIGAMPKF